MLNVREFILQFSLMLNLASVMNKENIFGIYQAKSAFYSSRGDFRVIKTQDDDFQEAPLMILPAAGFGRRAGIEGSKELLPGSQGMPLIQFYLELARLRKWPVHIITRSEKKDLIHYLNQASKNQQIEIQLIDTSREWPETVLKSEASWREKNILCLPDTEFAPVEILDQINEELDMAALVVGQFSVSDDFSSWGYIQKVSDDFIDICEKPETENLKNFMKPWGLLGFQKSFGRALFEAQLQSTFDHKWKQIGVQVLFLNLKEFKDATRKKVL